MLFRSQHKSDLQDLPERAEQRLAGCPRRAVARLQLVESRVLDAVATEVAPDERQESCGAGVEARDVEFPRETAPGLDARRRRRESGLEESGLPLVGPEPAARSRRKAARSRRGDAGAGPRSPGQPHGTPRAAARRSWPRSRYRGPRLGAPKRGRPSMGGFYLGRGDAPRPRDDR